MGLQAPTLCSIETSDTPGALGSACDSTEMQMPLTCRQTEMHCFTTVLTSDPSYRCMRDITQRGMGELPEGWRDAVGGSSQTSTAAACGYRMQTP